MRSLLKPAMKISIFGGSLYYATSLGAWGIPTDRTMTELKTAEWRRVISNLSSDIRVNLVGKETPKSGESVGYSMSKYLPDISKTRQLQFSDSWNKLVCVSVDALYKLPCNVQRGVTTSIQTVRSKIQDINEK